MQFLPLTQTELESTLLVLNRALEQDLLSENERSAVRSVLHKVGAGKIIEDNRVQGNSTPFPLDLSEEGQSSSRVTLVNSR